MSKLQLSLSCGNYDRTRFLIDGTVQPEGIDLTVIPLVSGERHARFTANLEFDICELQMGVFLGWKARDAPFTAIPVFPHRNFCHGNVLVNEASGIERPEDLQGKTLGLQAHFNPVSLWMRGVLQEEYGVDPHSLHLRTNAAEQVPGWTPAEWMDIKRVGPTTRVLELLGTGEVDAVMLPEVGPELASTPPTVRRLWENHRSVEQDYFRRTGFFPIRHTVVIKNEVLEKHPWVATSITKAFREAKELGIEHMRDPRRSFLAWYGSLIEEEDAFFGSDPWTYNLRDNLAALETMARYAVVCGITDRPLTLTEMFTTGSVVEEGLN